MYNYEEDELYDYEEDDDDAYKIYERILGKAAAERIKEEEYAEYEFYIEPLQDEDLYKYKGAEKYMRLAMRVLNKYKLKFHNGKIWCYDWDRGYYRKLSKKAYEKIILASLTQEQVVSLPSKGMQEIKTKIEEVLLLEPEIARFNANEYMINCRNGIAYITPDAKVKLLPHSRAIPFNYCLNARYLSKQERFKAEAFERFCETSFADDVENKTKLLLQMLGYIFSDSTRGKCMIVFVGMSNSGKSVLLHFIEELIPAEWVSNIPLSKLSSSFHRAEFADKKVNIQSELPSDTLKNLEWIKAMTSGDTVSAEYKMGDIISYIPTGKMLVATNTLPIPKSVDPTQGFLNRLRILFFAISIPKEKQDLELPEKLIAEKDIIFSMAIDALAELMMDKFQFVIPADTRRFIESYECNSNSFEMFVEDELIICQDAKIHGYDLFEKYKKYCKENGLDEMDKSKVREILAVKPGVKNSRFMYKNKNRHGYKGIGLKSDFFPMDTE